MADVHDKATRSRNMAAVRSRNTRPELLVRKGLHERGLRFRLHCAALPGKPDLVFPSRRAVLFVHGCFWHAHEGCRYFRLPQTDPDRWKNKLFGNRERDARTVEALREKGWHPLTVWECELRGDPEKRLDDLAAAIRSLG